MALTRRIKWDCFERDGWKCRFCGSRNDLHPHHFTYRSHGGTDDLNNLLTLCARCHRAHHDGLLDIIFLERTENDLSVRFVGGSRS